MRGRVKEMVRDSVEETLSGPPEADANQQTRALRCERNEARKGWYDRDLATASDDITYAAAERDPI